MAKLGFDLCDLALWPVTLTFAWTSLLLLVITPENFMMIWWWKHSEIGVTDGRTDRSVLRAAWSQLKMCPSTGSPKLQSNYSTQWHKIVQHYIHWPQILSIGGQSDTLKTNARMAPGLLWSPNGGTMVTKHFSVHTIASFRLRYKAVPWQMHHLDWGTRQCLGNASFRLRYKAVPRQCII